MNMTWSVSELNDYVRRSLAADPMLHGVRLQGEISNFKRHSSGHWYFSLKDEGAAINCAMFRQATYGVGFRPTDGMRVELTGNVGLYEKTGAYQFYVDAMSQEGLGGLYLRFEALKRKLEGEGLFDVARKKPIPLLPRAVGIVTSRTGAVLHDIQTVARRRNPAMKLMLCAAAVQGAEAKRQIVRAIQALDRKPEVDVIIVGRGGGSIEDLWPFNEETVARAIAACRTPVISAVGHETDVTITDFVADLRASTPSAAAEMAVCDRSELLGELEGIRQRLHFAVQGILQAKQAELLLLLERIRRQNPLRRLDALEKRIRLLENQLKTAAMEMMAQKHHELALLEARLRAVSPAQILSLGYAMVLKDGVPVCSIEGLKKDDHVVIRLKDGEADAHVEALRKEDA